MFSHAATILPVDDVSASVEFYTKILGFDCSFIWEEPPTYAVLNYKEKINIHLSLAHHETNPNPHHIAISFFVFDVDAVYHDLQSKGVEIHNPIGTRDYGMRDFDIKDNTGHLLTFGMYVGN